MRRSAGKTVILTLKSATKGGRVTQDEHARATSPAERLSSNQEPKRNTFSHNPLTVSLSPSQRNTRSRSITAQPNSTPKRFRWRQRGRLRRGYTAETLMTQRAVKQHQQHRRRDATHGRAREQGAGKASRRALHRRAAGRHGAQRGLRLAELN